MQKIFIGDGEINKDFKLNNLKIGIRNLYANN